MSTFRFELPSSIVTQLTEAKVDLGAMNDAIIEWLHDSGLTVEGKRVRVGKVKKDGTADAKQADKLSSKVIVKSAQTDGGVSRLCHTITRLVGEAWPLIEEFPGTALILPNGVVEAAAKAWPFTREPAKKK